MKNPHTVACPWMFENDKTVIEKWFTDNPDVDTIWHVARTCRQTGVRRNHDTFLTEHHGMLNLLSTRARNCRFVYASSKIVYGISGWDCCKEPCDHDYTPYNVEKVAEYFNDDRIGTFNCPDWQDKTSIEVTNHNNQRTIYALTKLANEQLIRRYCGNHKILRIWDIK